MVAPRGGSVPMGVFALGNGQVALLSHRHSHHGMVQQRHNLKSTSATWRGQKLAGRSDGFGEAQRFKHGSHSRIQRVQALDTGKERMAESHRAPPDIAHHSPPPSAQGLLAGKKVVVVGGGPAGMLASMRLAQQGATVDVYETREFDYDPGLNTWFIWLNSRGLEALESAGIDVESDPSIRFAGAHLSTAEGVLKPSEALNRGRALCGTRAMHTRFVQEQALQLCGDRVTLHHRCKMLSGDLAARKLRFQDLESGEEFEVQGDLIVGADGARSGVRSLMAEQVPGFSFDTQPNTHAIHAFRLPKVPGVEDLNSQGKPLQMFPEGETENAWIGEGNAVTFMFPKPGGVCIAVLYMYKSGRVDGTMSMPKAYWDKSYTEDEARAHVSSSLPQLPLFIVDLIAKILCNEPKPIPLPTSIKCSKVSAPGVLLIGDAAHAVTPTLGLGANSALEDSVIINKAVKQGEGDIESICRLFNEMRLADLHALVDIDRATLLAAPTSPGSLLTKAVRVGPLAANLILSKLTAQLPEFLRMPNYAEWVMTQTVSFSKVRTACFMSAAILALLALSVVAAIALLLFKAAAFLLAGAMRLMAASPSA